MGVKEKADIVLSKAQQFDAQLLFFEALEDMEVETQAVVWSALDVIEKAFITERKKAIRATLLDAADTFGVKDKKGHKVLDLDAVDVTVKREVRSGKVVPDLPAVLRFIEENIKNRPQLEDLVERRPVVNEDVLTQFVLDGTITRAEFNGLVSKGKETFVLKVDKPRALKKLARKKK